MSSTSGRERATTPAPEASAVLSKDVLKIKEPEPFQGNRNKLSGFLLQCEIYFKFHEEKFKIDGDKGMWVAMLLRGAAFHWIEPHLEDFLSNRHATGVPTTGAKQSTKDIFQTWKGFKNQIQKMFGDNDKKQTAERALISLRQYKSVAAYTAEFTQYAVRVNWGDEALMVQYRKGLKETVKDELMRRDKPDDLADLKNLAMGIDNRFQERASEKGGYYYRGHDKGNPRQNSQWPQPMELDAATQRGKPFQKKRLAPDEMERRRKERLCFESGKP